jgi:hypothetical protein
LNCRMMINNELERMWKEVVTAKFVALSWNFPGWTKESYKKLQSGVRFKAEIWTWDLLNTKQVW